MREFEQAWTLLKSLKEADAKMRRTQHLANLEMLRDLSRLAPYRTGGIMDDDNVMDAYSFSGGEEGYFDVNDPMYQHHEYVVADALRQMQGEIGAQHTLQQQLQELGMKDKARAKALGHMRHIGAGERQQSGSRQNQYPAEEHPMYGLVPEYPDQPSGPMAEMDDPMMATGEMPIPRGPLTEEENRKRLLDDMKRDFMRPETMSHGMNMAMLEMARRQNA